MRRVHEADERVDRLEWIFGCVVYAAVTIDTPTTSTTLWCSQVAD